MRVIEVLKALIAQSAILAGLSSFPGCIPCTQTPYPLYPSIP